MSKFNPKKEEDLSIFTLIRQSNLIQIFEILSRDYVHTILTATDFVGYTPLHEACMVGNVEIIDALLQKGANIEATTKGGWTPLHCAIDTNCESVSVLLKHGANINAKNLNGSTPLHFCTWKGKQDMSMLLISKGGDVNDKDNAGFTPLDNVKDLDTRRQFLDFFSSSKVLSKRMHFLDFLVGYNLSSVSTCNGLVSAPLPLPRSLVPSAAKALQIHDIYRSLIEFL